MTDPKHQTSANAAGSLGEKLTNAATPRYQGLLTLFGWRMP